MPAKPAVMTRPAVCPALWRKKSLWATRQRSAPRAVSAVWSLIRVTLRPPGRMKESCYDAPKTFAYLPLHVSALTSCPTPECVLNPPPMLAWKVGRRSRPQVTPRTGLHHCSPAGETGSPLFWETTVLQISFTTGWTCQNVQNRLN